jgi:hypothetical protein
MPRFSIGNWQAGAGLPESPKLRIGQGEHVAIVLRSNVNFLTDQGGGKRRLAIESSLWSLNLSARGTVRAATANASSQPIRPAKNKHKIAVEKSVCTIQGDFWKIGRASPFRPRPKKSNASDKANTAKLAGRFMFGPAA